MNYRHAFHAGNFADVVKHAVLTRLVLYLQAKDKAFRVIDTHAGRGSYDLSSPEAQRTGEWRGGIGRLLDAELPTDAAALLAPYLDAVRPGSGEAWRYPGSPALVRSLLRRQDRLTAVELHPEDAETLADLFAGDFQTRVIRLDGWLALNSQLPPKEKRGLVLVDPPFEAEDEWERLVEGLRLAHRRWPGGLYALWYPIKNQEDVAGFHTMLRALGIPKMLDIVLTVRAASPEPRLDGSGIVVVNPPFTLENELRIMLPALRNALAQEVGAGWSIEWLAGETAHH